MFDKKSLLQKLEQMNLDRTQYWLITGGAMVLYDAKEQTADIDLGCTSQLADQLQQKGCAVERMPDGTRRIVYDGQVEIFENWLEGPGCFVGRCSGDFAQRTYHHEAEAGAGEGFPRHRAAAAGIPGGRFGLLEPGDTLQRQPAEGRVPFQVLLQFPLLWGGKRFPKCGAHRKIFPLGSWFSRCR